MPDLIVFAGARAIREERKRYRGRDGLMPRMLRMDEFERRAASVPGKRMVDALQRVFYLREAADFREFEKLRTRRELLRFFTRSDDFFRFFEETAAEKVSPERLAEADAYAEFGEHLEVLERLRENYREILEREGFSDRMFLPESYELNRGFLASFERAEVRLEGIPSRFELELMQRIAREKELRIRLRSTRFNRKVLERLRETGVELPEEEGEILLDLSAGELLEFRPRKLRIDARVRAVQERYDQVAAAMEEIGEMVEAGIAPERIALILPDERVQEIYRRYDRLGNLNFAMGFGICAEPACFVLRRLEEYWRGGEERELEALEAAGVEREKLRALSPSQKVDLQGFFEMLELLGLEESMLPQRLASLGKRDEIGERILQTAFRFERLFGDRELRRDLWLRFWIEALEELRRDDVRGGKVTVMGVLETRGMEFDGVVIVDFNEGIVPAVSGKDRFLNSSVRQHAGLPTRRDREALQKHYYARLMEGAQSVSVLYSLAEHRLPSRFLYELGLGEARTRGAPRRLFYPDPYVRLDASREEPVAFDPLALRWSPTMLKSWLECRRKFYYRYLKKWREKEREGVQEGTILHEVLRRLYQNPRLPETPQEWMDRLREEMRRMLPPTPELDYYRTLWLKSLEPFAKREIERFSQGWEVEKVEEIVEGTLEGLTFAGRVDRIDRKERSRMLLDYKTGSIQDANRSGKFEEMSDFQMVIYRRLLDARYPGIEAAFVRILDGGEWEPLRAVEEKEEQLRQHLRELASCREFLPEKSEDPATCRYCPYQLICERGEYL